MTVEQIKQEICEVGQCLYAHGFVAANDGNISVKVGENESLESALKRFKRKCQKDGIIGDLRKREAYEKPSVKRKKKAEAARKRKNK